MDINLTSHDTSLEYIDMEPDSYLLRRGSSQHQREFEFQRSTDSLQREASTSPADELFYKGKLLPLHLPPRIEMVEKLLRDSVSAYEELYGTPLTAMAPASTTVSAPFESCNVSPCESCSISRELSPEVYSCESCSISRELNPEVYSPEYSTMDDCPKKLWSRNIKLIKQHLFVPKLKGSRAFLKSLIGKSGCSDESSTVAAKGFIAPSSRRRDTSLNSKENSHKGDGFRRVQPNRSPVKSSPEESTMEDDFSFRLHRRSLSLSGRWRQSNKICASSFSSSSSLSSSSSTSASKEQSASWRRSICPYVDTESPIQAAIAYCKQSQNPPVVLEKQPNSSDNLGTNHIRLLDSSM